MKHPEQTLPTSLALFLPAQEDAQRLAPLFESPQIRLHRIEAIHDLLSLLLSGEHIDAIALPLRLSRGQSGIARCLELRRESELSLIPILGISLNTEKHLLQSLYEAGADTVITPPFDAELFTLELQARRKEQERHAVQQEEALEKAIFRTSLLDAFQGIREGILLFDPEFTFLYGNERARILLDLSSSASEEDLKFLHDNFSEYLQGHQREKNRNSRESLPSSSREGTLTRRDGQSFRARIRILTLMNNRGQASGYALTYTDLGELSQLSEHLAQAKRLRSLSLMTAACLAPSLKPNSAGIVVSPLLRMEEHIAMEPLRSSFNRVISTLTEFTDLVIDPSIAMKIQGLTEVDVAMRYSDLFQLSGHLLLHLAEFAGQGGELQVLSEGDEQRLTIIFSARSRRSLKADEDDDISRLLRGKALSHEPFRNESSAPAQLPTGLQAAQEIATRYGALIEYQDPSASSVRMRIQLPLFTRVLSPE